MLRSSLISAALLASSQTALAQLPPPGAGGQLQQIPPAPLPQKPAADIQVERHAAAPDPAGAGAAIQVNSLRVTGNALFPEAELIEAADVPAGSELTLAGLRSAAARISDHYNSRGYFLAQAYLPAQDIKDGVVTIAVAEGRYGTTGVRNQTHLSDRAANHGLAGLRSGEPIAAAPLERRLLLLSDIPGINVRSTLAPGAALGTSDLIVDLAPGRRITGSAEADNAGNRYTGANRLGGTINWNSPLGIGDVLSLRLLGSSGGLGYGRAAYQARAGAATLGVAYTHLRYELGREFENLNADGKADIYSVFGSYPLIRSRDSNLYALAGLDAKELEDRVGLASARSDKSSRALTLGISGDSHDYFGGGGWNAVSVGWTAGDLHIQSPIERAADALSAGSEGGFGKLQLSAARLQTISGPLSLYGSVRGQLAFANLDSSEKMELGGAYGVRAYPEGEAYGDQGVIATLEARLTLGSWAEMLPGQLQLITFIDVGKVEFAHDPWFAGSNHSRRSGIGAGLVWAGPSDFVMKATYAHKLGDEAATSGPDKSGRFWFQVARSF
jgi:hemolysin activation/secretion protein